MRTMPSHTCIPKQWVCDRESDCRDASDEAGCEYTCPTGKVACRSGHIHRRPFVGYCIMENERCNGRQDCRDNSDEEGCEHITCPPHRFQCANVTNGGDACITPRHVCDRVADCAYHSGRTQLRLHVFGWHVRMRNRNHKSVAALWLLHRRRAIAAEVVPTATSGVTAAERAAGRNVYIRTKYAIKSGTALTTVTRTSVGDFRASTVWR